VVLDASALLALINAEPGCDVVAAALPEASIGVVNLSEVVTKMIDIGTSPRDAWADTSDLVPVVVDFNAELGRRTAQLRVLTRSLGLSFGDRAFGDRAFGDRACLALAEQSRLPVLTADHAWGKLSIGIEIRLIR
jgi:ribonuclease VapC